ncbi:hypothetical protein F5148DRAFT_1210051 [Russula earlei]|uniref:Uncharacterized protein n=2 Tax=Russula earlei TaxID=71964 RepID=A0ACC0TTW0_9AGAM|nr:hypothetical protein F5148DRAFT_1249127 [Russula earlei]KAI9464283.1 hypothetical protein F5148DRAFT_1210051 [Russula earlei]
MRTSAVVAFILAMGVAPSFSLPSIWPRTNDEFLRSAQSQRSQGQSHVQDQPQGQGQSQYFSDWQQWPSCQRAASCSPPGL